MYAAPVARVAYWATRHGLRKVPQFVVRSARRTSKAWRVWGNKFAKVAARAVGGVAAASGLGVMAGMKRKRAAGSRVRGRPSKRSRPVKAIPVRRIRPTVVRRRRPLRRTAPRKSYGASAAAGDYRNYSSRNVSLGPYRAVNPRKLVPWKIDRMMRAKVEDPKLAVASLSFPGAMALAKPDFTTPSGNIQFPLAVIDMTSHNNTAAGTASTNSYLLLQMDVATGNVSFASQATNISNGNYGTDSCWRDENTRHLIGGNLTNFERIQNHWYDVRLKLYGCSKQAVDYEIMLVQFTHDFLLPIATAAGGSETNIRNAVWQSMVRKCVSNTIFTGSAEWRKYVRVRKYQRVRIPASQTIDQDIIPTSVNVKWFVRDGRILEYLENLAPFSSATALGTSGFAVLPTTNITDRPKPQSQLFLVIRATDMISESLTDYNYENTPSFDLLVRRKASLYR